MLSVFNPGRTFCLKEQQRHKIISAKYVAFLKCLLSTEDLHLFIQNLMEYFFTYHICLPFISTEAAIQMVRYFSFFHAVENHAISTVKPSIQEHQSRYSHIQFVYVY